MEKLYMNRKNRDAEAKRLKAKGCLVKKGSDKNQLLHPAYVEDWKQETGRELTNADLGFGNQIYKTLFKTLYTLAIMEGSDY